MSALVCKLRSKFFSKMKDLYNKEVYFLSTCEKFPSKFSLQNQLLDLQLRIHFEENNKVVIDGKLVKYCDKDGEKRKVRIKNISDDLTYPEVNVINNYLISDKWDKTDW